MSGVIDMLYCIANCCPPTPLPHSQKIGFRGELSWIPPWQWLLLVIQYNTMQYDLDIAVFTFMTYIMSPSFSLTRLFTQWCITPTITTTVSQIRYSSSIHCNINPLYIRTPPYNTYSYSTPSVRSYSISLNTLPRSPSHHQRDRVGRGPGSGMGKTSKRGHKGQGARSHVKTIYEGGQTPMWRRTPKRGFNILQYNNKYTYTELNLMTLMSWIHSNRIDTQQPITLNTIHNNGIKIKHGIKLLARGSSTVDRPIHVIVNDCTIQAKLAIEKSGGTVTLKYYNDVALRSLLYPEKYNGGLRPSTECTPPARLRYKYEKQLCSGEYTVDQPLNIRQQMIQSGQTTKQKIKS